MHDLFLLQMDWILLLLSNGLLEPKDLLFLVSCRSLGCVSVQKSEGSTCKRYFIAQTRAWLRVVNDIYRVF